jgi:hypothetical protein
MSISWMRRTNPLITLLALLWTATSFAQNTRYLITNDDNSQGNSATFFKIGNGGQLSPAGVVKTHGFGWDGLGSVVTNKIVVTHDRGGDCAYLSDYVSDGGFARTDVASISIANHTLVGDVEASAADQVQTLGMGLSANPSYLYAEFSQSLTIGTYKRLAGCKLQFVGDIPASGITGSAIITMKAHNNILVVTYFDGSIESFDVSSGTPVSNGDLQYSTAHTQQGFDPSAIDLTADGHYAIFGDTGSTVEVSDISSGKLTPTVIYSGVGSGNVIGGLYLSPDETLLYLTDFSNGKVNAAFFDASTGVVTPGCTSAVLHGFGHLVGFVASVVTALPTGTGSAIYTADPSARISTLRVNERAGACTLSEPQTSPVADKNTETLESIGVFPPRPF